MPVGVIYFVIINSLSKYHVLIHISAVGRGLIYMPYSMGMMLRMIFIANTKLSK